MAFQLDNISKPKSVAHKKKDTTSFLQKEITLFGSSFSNKIKEDLYSELSVLLKAGITLKDALELIENSHKKKQHKDILKTISESIVSGKTLSQSVKEQKEFTDYEYYSLKIGEETGTLDQVISALTYPIIILSTAILVLVFMLSYVVPMFQDIFKQQKVELPAITKFIIGASEFMKNYGWLLLILLLILILSRAFFNKKLWFKKAKDKLVLKLPFIGNFIKTVYLSQFTQAVALLTASKVPVVNSIQLVKQMIDFHPLKEALNTVEESILKGSTLSNSLKEHKLFDDKMVAMVKVAEETNQNEFIFERLNTQYNTQVQQRSKLLSTLMEPFIILFVGVLVGVILIAMYLPMFKLSSVLG